MCPPSNITNHDGSGGTQAMDSATSETATPGGTSIKRRQRLLAAAGVVVALAVTGGVVALANAGGSSYDETAHRTAVEAELGHEVSDWDTIAGIAKDDCAKNDADLQLAAATAKDGVLTEGSWDAFDVRVIGLSFRCPDRVATFVIPPAMPALGSAAADQIRRATEDAR